MWLSFDGIVNVRDLGGMTGAEGRRVKMGRLLRGAVLAEASDEDVRRLAEEFHVKEIVDFRMGDECERQPNRPVAGAVCHSIPALEASRKEDAAAMGSPTPGVEPDLFAAFKSVYAKFAESDYTAKAYRQYFDILLGCTEGAVFFHCAQGKDRTGIAAILTLTALGVSRADAVEDFFLSNIGLKDEVDRPGLPGAKDWSRATRERLTFVFPEALEEFMRRAEGNYGGLMGFLTQHIGVTEAEIARLRELYLE